MAPRTPGPRFKGEPRVFMFEEADYSVPVPDNIPTPTRSNQLPFRAWFDKHAQAALDGKAPHQFVPHAYWTLPQDEGGRGVTDPKPTIDSYARTKIRDQFSAWKRDNEVAGNKLNFIAIVRTGNEGIEGITEPGLSIWLQKTK